MEGFTTLMGSIATTVTDVAGDFVGIVVAQPVLLVPIAIGVVYGGVKVVKSFF